MMCAFGNCVRVCGFWSGVCLIGCVNSDHIPTNSNLAHLALAVREGRADDAAPPRVEVRGGRSAQGAERDGQLRSDRQLLIIVVWDTWFGG